MSTILVAAFAAGMVSTVNPCGFAMLPAYLGYYLGDRTGRRAGQAGTVALFVSAGFLAVFTAAGLLIGLGVRAVIGALPWLALAVGVGLVLAGFAQLLGRRVIPYLRGPSRARRGDSPAGMFVFGVSYAVASLSCTLPIFLSLVTGAIASGSPAQAVLTFVAYGAGMALVVVGLTVAVAGGHRTIIDRIRPIASRLDAISAWVMTAAGLFIIWYWATVLSAGSLVLGANPLVRAIDRWSAAATGFVAARPLLVAAGLIGLVLLAALRVRRRRDHAAGDVGLLEGAESPPSGQPLGHR
jgi:cytochrome c-type biogenesis protein